MADVAPDLRGRDVVHIQCHVGFDTIALARRGARVTGVDFSRASLAKAAELTERCGVEIEWVQANATALPDSLRGGFDVAYATIGAICWIEDIGAWMRSAAATLRPGGRLVLVEIHPLYAMVEAAGEPLRLDFPYAFDGPRRFDEPGSCRPGRACAGHCGGRLRALAGRGRQRRDRCGAADRRAA